MARPRTSTPMSRIPVLGRKHARYEIRTRYNGVGFVSAQPVRDHINELRGLGLTSASIARDAGVHIKAVRELGDGDRETSRVRVAHAIMRVDFHPNPRQEMVLSIGALRRVRALANLGWSSTHIANNAKISVEVVQMLHRCPTTGWATWSAIRDTYEALSATLATEGRPKYVRNLARARGWPAPLDWEGHDIDDPRVEVVAQPWQPKTMQELLAERRAQVAELTAAGLSAAEIADRLGVAQRTVVRDRLEVGVAAA